MLRLTTRSALRCAPVLFRSYAKNTIIPLKSEKPNNILYKKMVQDQKQQIEDDKPKIFRPTVRQVAVSRPMCIRELGNLIGIKPKDLLTVLPKEMDCNIDDVLSIATLRDVCKATRVKLIHTPPTQLDKKLFNMITPYNKREEKEKIETVQRGPVVTIMGHVDHGKTTLLDALRNTNVVDKEAGGITQHIAAFQVQVNESSLPITFIDTPGHEAFTHMRAAGASVTDIVVLVVAADDGLMPQTHEAIKHARDANVPIIVAINKIDKSNADVDLVIEELAKVGLVDSIVQISALKKTNLNLLIEEISLLSQVLDLQAPVIGPMEAICIESKLDRGHGTHVTAIVKRGTMKVGQIVIAGTETGRIRALLDYNGIHVKEGLPSHPMHIIGFEGLPNAGEYIMQVETEDQAEAVIEYRTGIQKMKLLDDQARENEEKKMKLYELKQGMSSDVMKSGSRFSVYKQELAEKAKHEQEAEKMLDKEVHSKLELAIIFRADVQGAINAFQEIISTFPTQEVQLKIIRQGVGVITETDIIAARTADATIIGMNVKPSERIQAFAKLQGVTITTFRVIYHLIDHLKKTLAAKLPPVIKEIVVGEAECKDVFNLDDKEHTAVAGCTVVNGLVSTGAEYYRVLRYNKPVYDKLSISSLYHFKDKVKEVKKGNDCGIALTGYPEPKKGDRIQAVTTQKIYRTFEDMIK